MKGLYIHDVIHNDFSGVSKKIKGTLKAFRNNGFEIEEYIVENKLLQANIFRKIWISLNIFANANSFRGYPEISYKLDFVYIRKPVFDRNFNKFLKTLKSFYDLHIILEMPTYPYNHELSKSIKTLPFYFKEIFFSRFIRNYVDLIVSFTNLDYIFGINTINIANGVDKSEINIIRHRSNGLNKIKMLSVNSLIRASNGYDRLIKGIAQSQLNVQLTIIGEGKECDKLRKLSFEYGLENRINFHVKLSTKEINKLYKSHHICVGPLGIHRTNLSVASPLKTKEYLSKGLPVLKSYIESNINDFGLFINVPGDDDPIDLDYVYSEYLKIKSKLAEINEEKLDFISWDYQLAPLFQHLEGNINQIETIDN